jgi:hypothetical protein
VLNLGVPTAYIPHGKPERILGQLGLDGPGIAASIFKAIDPAPGLRAPAYMGVEDRTADRASIEADAASLS